MSTTPRIGSATPGEAASFSTVMAHVPDVIGAFFALYASFWQSAVVPADLKEMTRLRNARVTDCGY